MGSSSHTAVIGGREVPIRPARDDKTASYASPEERARRERELSDRIREEDARSSRSRSGLVDSSVPDSAYRRAVPGSFSERLRMEEGTTEEQLRGRRLERFQPPRDPYNHDNLYEPTAALGAGPRRRSMQSPSSGAFAPASSIGSSFSNLSSRPPHTPPQRVTRGFVIPPSISSTPIPGSSGDKSPPGDFPSSYHARRTSFSVRSPSPSRIERPPSPNSGYVGRDGKWVAFSESERKASIALAYRMRQLYGEPNSNS